MQTLLQDVRYALRNLTRAPGFAAIVVLTLALGIGTNTAIFSIVNTVVLKPLSYPDADQLVRITSELRARAVEDTGVASQELFDYQELTDVFSGVAGLYPINANVTGGEEPERVEMMLVSPNYFTVLGGRAQLGRVFGPDDNGPGIPEVTIVSDGYWRRRLGADPNVLGRTLMVDGDPFVLVGVMPPDFRHPGRTVQTEVDMWSPAGYRAMPFGPPSRSPRFLEGAFARLRPGVSFEQAQARLNAYGARMQQENPSDYPDSSGWNPLLMPLQNDVVGRVATPMLILLGAVGLVLLIVCANVAHLVLVRASERQQELAIRQALGASSARLTRQMLTESAVLATVGAIVGLLVAAWGMQALISMAPSRVPRLNEVSMDATAVGVTALLAVITTLLFGMVPAWQMRAINTFSVVKEGGRGRSAGAGRARVRNGLVVAEVALAMVLLVGAGLLVRSVSQLLNVSVGFETSNLLTARVWLPRPNDAANGVYLEPERRVTFMRETLDRLNALPGVEQVALSNQIPLAGFNRPIFFEPEGLERAAEDGLPTIHSFQVSADYFDTMQIPVVRGRGFSDSDRAGTEPVALISRGAAQSLWGTDDVVGKRVRVSTGSPWMTIVGVAGDVRNRWIDEGPQPILYRPLEQSSGLALSVLLRTTSGATGLGESLAREIKAIDANLPVYSIRTMDDVLEGAVAQRAFVMRILLIFGLAAVGLALLGIYGVISYSVSQRTREIGIRMAIGARHQDVSRMVMRQGLVLMAVGVALGLLGALVLSRFITSQLYGVTPNDPVTLAGVFVVMVVVAMVASYLPARRAARVDPILALRAD